MPSNRFFVSKHLQLNETITIEKSDAHKITHVLRMSSGDEIIVCDSSSNEYRAVLELNGNTAQAKLTELVTSKTGDPLTLHITVAQALPKGQKMDFIVEKLTELGVAKIIPFISERTISKCTDTKIERWRRLAKAAAQQSGRSDIPEIV